MGTVKVTKKTTGSLWNYYRDEPSSNIGANNITNSILNSESFDYQSNFMENGVTLDNLTKNYTKVIVPQKHLSNFWRHLDIPLIIVIRNGKIVWKHGPNRPFFLHNLSSENY